MLRLHEGIGAASARRVLDALDLAEPGQFERWPAAAGAAPRRAREHLTATITELAFVPDAAGDGCYLLQLQVPALDGDAVPCRPLLYPLTASA